MKGERERGRGQGRDEEIEKGWGGRERSGKGLPELGEGWRGWEGEVRLDRGMMILVIDGEIGGRMKRQGEEPKLGGEIQSLEKRLRTERLGERRQIGEEGFRT